MALLFKPITVEEARECVHKWHYVNDQLHDGKYCFGAFKDGNLIAAAVFVNCRSQHSEGAGELIATVKDPVVKFQMSQLLKYSRQQLKDTYSILVTYCNMNHAGQGGQLKGDYWNYSGIVRHVAIEPPCEETPATGFHLYWVPLTNEGKSFAISKGLERRPYPKYAAACVPP